VKLTATDKKVLKRAIEEVLRNWSIASGNLGVIARSPDGAWASSPQTAKRNKNALDNRRRALMAITKKLDIKLEESAD
jgi:hypothetical protein